MKQTIKALTIILAIANYQLTLASNTPVTVKIWNDNAYQTVCFKGATPTECLSPDTGKSISLSTTSGKIQAKLGNDSSYQTYDLNHRLPTPQGTWVCKNKSGGLHAVFSAGAIHQNYWLTQAYYEIASQCGTVENNSYYPVYPKK